MSRVLFAGLTCLLAASVPSVEPSDEGALERKAKPILAASGWAVQSESYGSGPGEGVRIVKSSDAVWSGDYE